MGVKARLALLRGQIGGPSPVAAPPTSPSLSERIGRLRPSGRRRIDDADLARICGGRLISPGLILVEDRIPLSREHGIRPLRWIAETPSDLPEAQGRNPRNLVFIDTETTGLAGGSGTLAFLIGMAVIEGEALRIRQYLVSCFAAEAAMLEAAGKVLEQAAGILSYNGKSFDLPLLVTRCRMARCRDRFSTLPHVDLLHPLRRAFRARWPDCRLASAEQRLLMFHRTGDLPGAAAPQAWFDYLQRGDPGRLPAVVRHNRWDLLSLALLLPVLDRVYRDPGSWGADVQAIARRRIAEQGEDDAMALLQANRHNLDRDGLLELARLLKRQGRWRECCAIWERLVDSGDPAAVEQLAKYHEHVNRRWDLALGFAQQLPPGPGREIRENRLRKKMVETAHQKRQLNASSRA